MHDDHPHGPIDRLRAYGRALVIAAGVSFGQLGDTSRGPHRPPTAIVHLLPERKDAFDRLETVEAAVLTQRLVVGEESEPRRFTESPN